MNTPVADHPITIAPSRSRVRAKVHEHVIADFADALVLAEAGYPPVIYFPRADVETGFLSESPLVTECPHKGRATHYGMVIDGVVIEKAAWSYQDPHTGVEAIRDLIAFYPGEIEIYEVEEDALDRQRYQGQERARTVR